MRIVSSFYCDIQLQTVDTSGGLCATSQFQNSFCFVLHQTDIQLKTADTSEDLTKDYRDYVAISQHFKGFF